MNGKQRFRLFAAASLLALSSGAAWGQAGVTHQLDIASGSLSEALSRLADQTNLQVVFYVEDTQSLRAGALRGQYTPEQALQQLLSGSDLEFRYVDARTISVKRKGVAVSDAQASAQSRSDIALVALMQTSDAPQAAATEESRAQSSQNRRAERPVTAEADTVVVTGTNIRNVNDNFSPVTTISRESLDRAGMARVSDYITRLPQNFGGGPSPDQSGGAGSGAGAETINLRGLGNEATLILFNGRRMTPGGLSGNYIDISSIPTGALERIDVLTDGASAIYGSDAISGVVNFILRKDYNGNESRVRYGGASGGALEEFSAAHTLGRTGERGRMLLSYEYSSKAPLDANDREFTQVLPDPYEILAQTRVHSVFFSGALNLSERAELFTDAYYNERNSKQWMTFQPTSRPVRDDVTVEQVGATVGAGFTFANDWRAEISGTAATSDYFNWQMTVNPAPGANGGLNDDTETRVWSLDGKIDGALFQLPGGAARAVIGAQHRDEKHDGFTDFFNQSGNLVGQRQVAADTGRTVSAAFTEVYLPFVGANNARAGVRRLSMSVAGRYEDYSDFGNTFNPKIGLLWAPVENFSFRGTYGTSFRAARLQQLVDNISYLAVIDYADVDVPGGRSVGALMYGDSSDLDPEESTSWTVGFDYQPEFVEGLELRTTYYKIEYDKRIATPFPSVDGSTYVFYDYPLPVNRSITLAQLQAYLAEADFPLFNYTNIMPGGSNSTLADVTVFLDGRNTNTTASHMSGLDFTATYELPTAIGGVQLFVNSSYIFDATEQFSPLRPVVKKYNVVSSPTDLRVRSGATWSNGSSAAGLFVNYMDNYRDTQSAGGASTVSSWTTLDASYQYDFSERFGNGLLNGVKLTVSALNLFDRDPPKLTQLVAPGVNSRSVLYDKTNADPQGRVLGLQLTKQW